MAKCPDYYLLADGTEFVDFFHERCIGYLFAFHPSAMHAIQSAMEHRFRMGWKTENPEHDIIAMTFWTTKAFEYIRRTTHDWNERVAAVETVKLVTGLVDDQRELKKLVNTN